jgi:putative transposase
MIGSPRMHEDLVADGTSTSLSRVARLMAMQEARTLGTTILSATRHSESSGAEFLRYGADTKWVTDITEIPTQEGKLFLWEVLDLFNSWSLA